MNCPKLSEKYEIDDKLIFKDEEFCYRYSDCEDSDDNINEDYVDKIPASEQSITEVCKQISSQLTHTYSQWTIECFVPNNAQKKFLRKVRDNIPMLHMPLDPRTITEAPRRAAVHQIKGGEYCHFGLKPALEKIVQDRKLLDIANNQIKLFINIDGVPTGKDAEKNLWPILCSDTTTGKIYIIGVYCGKAKPKDVNEYLSLFVQEAKFLIINGLQVDDHQYEVLIVGFIMDAPAKAYILGVKCHSGYFSCTKCEIEGIRDQCVCFPGGIGILRTDEKFRAFKDYRRQGYQLKKTLLSEIPKIDLVNQIPIDTMHLLSGVTKKCFLIWKHSSTKYRLAIVKIDEISNALIGIRRFVPYEFARKPRGLNHINQYKCTELRQIQYYTGPVVLKGRVNKKVYNNFVMFHVVVSILSNPILCHIRERVDYAERLARIFVKKFQKLYGSRYVSQNIHNVQHLANDSRRYGELEKFSAYDFENFIARIKRLVNSGNKISEQLANRCAEIELLETRRSNLSCKNFPDLKQPHTNGPVPNIFRKVLQYKVGLFHSFKINCDDAINNYLYINNGHYAKIVNIIESNNCVFVVGRKLKVIGPLYKKPCSSSDLGINILDLDSPSPSETQYWNVDEIIAKLFIIPYKGNFVAFPMLHTIQWPLKQ